MVFLIYLQILPQIFLILRRTERDKTKNGYWSSYKVHVILVRIKWILNFLDSYFRKNPNIKFH